MAQHQIIYSSYLSTWRRLTEQSSIDFSLVFAIVLEDKGAIHLL